MGDTHHHHHCHIRHNHHVYHHPHMDTTLTEDRLSTITTSSTTTTSTTTVTTKHNNVNHHHHYHRHYHHHHHHHHYSPEKSENLTEDRLSSLPDALLTHILSLLSTKDSVRTSVLSKRWKYIFRHVPSLSFHYDKPETSLAFVKFVDGVLHVHNVWSIRSFQLFLNSFIHDFTVYPWICAAIRRNATRIEVDAKLAQPCALPFNLFKSQMLVHLELCGRFVFGITDTVNLPNLKNLRIKSCVFPSGDLAARLFSSCPVLEELTFDSCGTKGIKVMSISVPSLKRLSISCNYSKCEWELNVPNLEYINCEGKTAKWYSISILKSLNKACIRLKDYDDVGDKLSGLINKFEEVKFLSLSDDSMEALACVSFSPPIFSKLKILKLKVECYQGWSFFPTLLERAPCLELLVIPEPGFSDGDEEFPDIGTRLPKSVPICFSRSLKEVEHYWSEEDLEYEWLGYLVEYAKVLEKLTIFVKSFRHEAPASYLERRSVIRAVLLALPRGSNTCEIVVKEK